MPEETKPPAEKPSAPAQPPKEPLKAKTPPKAEKYESLKFDLTFVNGGFNDGVDVMPGKNGTLELRITLYGGGESKHLTIGPLPKPLETLIRGYEVSANGGSDTTPEITNDLKVQFQKIKEKLSLDIIKYLQEFDAKVEASIKETLRTMFWKFVA